MMPAGHSEAHAGSQELSETQSEVLAVVERATEPPGLSTIAEALGSDRQRDERRYKKIQSAIRSLEKKGLLDFKTSPYTGVRFYYRSGERRDAVSQLFARFGGAETAREMVDYGRQNEEIWPALRKALREAERGSAGSRRPRR